MARHITIDQVALYLSAWLAENQIDSGSVELVLRAKHARLRPVLIGSALSDVAKSVDSLRVIEPGAKLRSIAGIDMVFE
jgi:hypothetical protein